MRRLIYCLITFIVLTSGSCDKMPLAEKFYFIEIQNKPPKPIYFYEASIEMDTQYPDTTLPVIKPSLVKVKPGGKFFIDSRTKWEDNIQKLPKDTLSIFIMDSESHESKGWDEMRNNYLILKRYDLSVEDLKGLDWTITYPPTTEMQNIKMFPKYKP